MSLILAVGGFQDGNVAIIPRDSGRNPFVRVPSLLAKPFINRPGWELISLTMKGFSDKKGRTTAIPLNGFANEGWMPRASYPAMCKTMKHVLIILMAVLVGGRAVLVFSQESVQPTALDLAAAIQMALENHPSIEAARFREQASQERINQAFSGFLPRLDLNESFQRTNNPMYAFGTKLNQGEIAPEDFAPDRLNHPNGINNFGTSMALKWPIFDKGQTWHGWRQARLDKESTDLMAARTRQLVIADTAMAYLGLLMAAQRLELANETLKTARAHLRLVESRYERGFVVKSDVLQARVRIADVEQQIIDAEAEVTVGRARLNVAMGVLPDSHHQITGTLQPGGPLVRTLEDWVGEALAKRPDLKELEVQEGMSREETDKQRAANLPSLDLVSNYEINTESFENSADNYTIGAVLSFNLFSGFRDSSKAREAEASLREVMALRRNLRQQISMETRRAFVLAHSAWRRIQVAEATVDQAEEALRIISNRYSEGLLTILDLLNGELTLQQARTNRFRSIHDYQAARVQLALAVGLLDETFRLAGDQSSVISDQ
jgi:outer membrane protein